jgi:hypothetical protein
MFLSGATALEKMRAFRQERICFVCSGVGQRPLIGNGRLFVHLMPYASFLSTTPIELRAAREHHLAFAPIGSGGHSQGFNLDGFINERGGAENSGYTQVFRNGIVEATKAGLVHNHQGVPLISGRSFEKQFFEAVPRYMEGLRMLNVPAPVCVLVTLEGVNGAAYSVPVDSFSDPDAPFDRQEVSLPECIIDEYGDAASYSKKLRPIFDALWNASGHERAHWFDADGRWVGPPR